MKLKKAVVFIAFVLLAISFGNSKTAFASVPTQISDTDFFNQINLELPDLSGVKQAVNVGDYSLATERLLNYYKVRQGPKWYNQPTQPRVNNYFSRIKADEIVNHIFTINSITACPDNPPGSGNINWLYTPNGDKEWYWALNRQFHMKDLGTAYQETSDSKYALEFEKQFLDWAADNPVPSTVDTVGAWRTIEAGLRLSESMLYYFNQFLYCDSISNETKLAVLKTFYEHGEYLYKFCGSNNWLLFECKGLYALSVVYPEFKRAADWKSKSIERLTAEVNKQFLPDGWQWELTPNYHLESLKSVQAVIDLATLNNESLPFTLTLSKAYEVIADLILPGGRLNPLNDTGWCLGYDMLRTATTVPIDYEKSSSFLYLASNSLSGNPNGLSTSVANFNAGLAHFRDFIGNGGIYGMLEGGPSGVGGHGYSSKDKLQFTLSAFDRELLIDPGVYSYAGQDIAKYMYTTKAHNTITIDGYDQSRRSQDVSSPDKNFEAYFGSGLDYAAGVYNEGYDETLRIPVNHKREVMYVKSGYFLVSDELTGSGQHTARQFWNFAPGPYNIDNVSKRVNTNFGDNNNVLIVPINPSEVVLEYADGQESPLLGWTSSGTNKAVSTLNMDYKYTGSFPYKMQTLIVPYQGANPPQVTIEKGGYIKIQFENYTDYLLVSNSNQSYGEFSFNGKAAVIRSENGVLTNASCLPSGSSIIKENQTLDLPEIECRKRNQITKTAKPNGIYQAEWTDFTQVGNAKYVYDSLASAKYAVSLSDNASIRLPVEDGLKTVKIKARTGGEAATVALIGDGITKSTFNVTSSGSYTKFSCNTSSRVIEIKVLSGSCVIDSVELVGSGTESSNKLMLRQRMPTQNAAISFGSDSYTDYTVTSDFNLISALSQKKSAKIGLRVREGYSFYYDDGSKKLIMAKGDNVLASCDAQLDYMKWYTFTMSAIGTSLQGTISEKGGQPIKLLCAYDSDYQSGMGQLFCDYADCGADNLKLVLSSGSTIFNETLEEYYSGLRPNNWTDTESGMWRTEKSVYQMTEDDFNLSCNQTAEYAEGDTVSFTYAGNNEGKTIGLYDYDKLIISFTDAYGVYRWTAEGGDHEFCIKSEDKASNVIKLRVSGVNKYTESLKIDEHFDSYTGGLPAGAAGTGNMTLTSYDVNKKLKLTNSSTTSELYYNFPSTFTGNLIFETELIPLATNVRTPVFVFKDSNNMESYLLLFNSNGEIVNKKTGLSIQKYTSNTVYKIRMEVDCVNNVWSLYINGKKVVSDDMLPNSMKNAIRVYIVKMWDSGSLLLDDIKIGNFYEAPQKTVVIQNSSGKIFEEGLISDSNETYGVLWKDGFIDKIFLLNSQQNLITVSDGNKYKFEILTWNNINEMVPIKNKYTYFISS